MNSKTYRAILIDPEQRSIKELQSDCSLDSIHQLVGISTLDHFSIASYEDGGLDYGWVSDDGLSGDPVHAFLLPISKDPIAGRCLIVAADHYGETASTRIPVSLLQRDLIWLGLILPEVTWDHTETGSRAIVTYSRVKQ
jgi:hypothetical protein